MSANSVPATDSQQASNKRRALRGAIRRSFETSPRDLVLLQALIGLAALGALLSAVGIVGFGIASDSGRPYLLTGSSEANTIATTLAGEEAQRFVDDAQPELAGDVELMELTLRLPATGTAAWMSRTATLLVSLSVAATAAALFLVVGDAGPQKLFRKRNVRLLQGAAAALLVAQVGGFIGSLAQMEALDQAGLTPGASMTFAPAMAAAALIALARVWDVGTGLADEAALTV